MNLFWVWKRTKLALEFVGLDWENLKLRMELGKSTIRLCSATQSKFHKHQCHRNQKLHQLRPLLALAFFRVSQRKLELDLAAFEMMDNGDNWRDDDDSNGGDGGAIDVFSLFRKLPESIRMTTPRVAFQWPNIFSAVLTRY